MMLRTIMVLLLAVVLFCVASSCAKPNASITAVLILAAAGGGFMAYDYYTADEGVVGPPVLTVENQTTTTMTIWVDGVIVGTVPSGTTLSFTVTVGSRLLEAGETVPVVSKEQSFSEGFEFKWTLVD